MPISETGLFLVRPVSCQYSRVRFAIVPPHKAGLLVGLLLSSPHVKLVLMPETRLAKGTPL
jgi:hypothetical protein